MQSRGGKHPLSDKHLAQRIRRLATREWISLNQAVLKVLRKGAGLGEGKDSANTVGSSLDDLIGTWTPDEADELERALNDLGQIDKSVW